MTCLAKFQCRLPILIAVASALSLLVGNGDAYGQQAQVQILDIGTSGTLAGEKAEKEKAALQTLQSFIKEETGLANNINRQKDWRELGEKMSKKELQIGVFQGYEFAWAQEKFPTLKPLALAVNVRLYPVVHVVAKADSSASNFLGLKGKTLSLPGTGQRYLRLFVERQSEAAGSNANAFFAKIALADNVENAVDDVVDGKADAAVADRASLDTYKRLKPFRFDRLKQVAQSEPFPPTVIAYADKAIDPQTLKKFRDGLVNAKNKERGRALLTTFRLTGFDPVPEDFEKRLVEARKTYPPPKEK